MMKWRWHLLVGVFLFGLFSQVSLAGHDELVRAIESDDAARVEREAAKVGSVIRGRHGESYIAIAAEKKKLVALRTLLRIWRERWKEFKNDSDLLTVVRNGETEAALLLIQEGGAEVNKVEANGLTPLQVAREMKRSEMVTLLLDNGALEVTVGADLAENPSAAAAAAPPPDVNTCPTRSSAAAATPANTCPALRAPVAAGAAGYSPRPPDTVTPRTKSLRKLLREAGYKTLVLKPPADHSEQ